MESTSKGTVKKKSLFRPFGNLSIRSKLMLAFMVMIALILVVSGITFISQRLAKKTINDLVEVQSKIARLSLETENTLSVMQRLEKSFMLNYQKIGVQEAKKEYVGPFDTEGGIAYQQLYKIKGLATSQQERDAAQSAIVAIAQYQNAFIGTVNIIELRVDKEFGELGKLQSSISALDKSIGTLNSVALRDAFFRMKSAIQNYLIASGKKTAAAVVSQQKDLAAAIAGANLPEAVRNKLSNETGEFGKWFTEVTKTDEVISARIDAYQAAIQKANPIIATFLKSATANEAAATAKMENTTRLVSLVVLGVGVFTILLSLFIAFGLSRGLTRQLNHISNLISEISTGNFDARAEVVSNDEIGDMAATLNAMLDNITLLIQSQSERDAIQESIMKLLEEISALTDGDLTARAEVTEDMTGAIADSFNAMTEQFSDIIQKVKAATASVDDTSEDVSRLTMTLANKNIEQAKKVTDAIDAINTMAESIRKVSSNAQQSADVSERSRMNAREGAEAVQKTNAAMNEIREQINETARSIKRLGESSMEIGNVIQIIDDIADRTSILALNASIQAAMAGDAGHGFAVVADEVQRLAESSSNSTKQIEALIKNIQTEIKNVTSRMDESISTVVKGSQLADGAHQKLHEIELVSNQLADLIEAITAATTEQVRVSEEISSTMQEVGEVSKESSLSSQETATSMDTLSKTARDLRAAVEIFKVAEVAQVN